MKIRFTKKDFLTIPNLLSLLRILLIAPFVCFFISGNYVAAAINGMNIVKEIYVKGKLVNIVVKK